MRGKIIVIEGLDGSGKATEAELLLKNLRAAGISCKSLSFPRYEKTSSALVRGYLGGEFGSDPAAVNGYAASSFYAADRYISYITEWQADYESGTSFVFDRYTTSNAVYQAGKLPQSERAAFLDWLYDYEYNRLGLPKPDMVIYLDMPAETAAELMMKRYGGDGCRMDIHERDRSFQNQCRMSAALCAERGGWKIISCAEDGRPLPVEIISQRILQSVRGVFGL